MSNFLNGVGTAVSWLLNQLGVVSNALMSNAIFQIGVAIFIISLLVYIISNFVNIKRKKSDD